MEFKPLIGITYEFIFQLVNTFLVFFLLKKLLFKPVLGIIEARENDIRENLAQGERAKKEGLTLKSEYEEKLTSAKEQGQEIIKASVFRNGGDTLRCLIAGFIMRTKKAKCNLFAFEI